jgi:6-phosphogluconolactonase
MQLEVLPDADAVARRGAEVIAAEARKAVAERGKFVVAVSGGTTPWVMLKALAAMDVPWAGIHVVQVDERAAPDGHADRNLTHLRASLLANVPQLPAANVHPMPTTAENLEAAADEYAATLHALLGPGGALVVCHLGLGGDGHTASLVPGDPSLKVFDRDVTVTGVYQGRRRMTLTYPVLNRAKMVLWLVTGDSKRDALAKLRAADPSIPGGLVNQERALVLADKAAVG